MIQKKYLGNPNILAIVPEIVIFILPKSSYNSFALKIKLIYILQFQQHKGGIIWTQTAVMQKNLLEHKDN